MGKIIVAAFIVAFGSDFALSGEWRVSPPDSGVKITSAKKGVRWQTTKSTLLSFRWLKEAFMEGGPVGVVLGAVGTPVAAAILVVSPPIDLVTTPLRWKNTFNMELSGRITRDGVPLARSPVFLSAQAYASNDFLPFHVFSSTSTTVVTGPDGEFSAVIRASIGANRSFEIKLHGEHEICSWMVVARKKRKLEVRRQENYPYRIFSE